MTTREFEEAQLRLDIHEWNDRLAVVDEVDPEEAEDFRQALQAYFERRD